MNGPSGWWRRLWRCIRGQHSRPAEGESTAEASPGSRLSPQQLYAACRRRVNWQAEWVRHLTPMHLAVSGEAPDDDPIARALRTQTANLCILFTADWSKRAYPPATDFVATYAGAQREVQVVLAEPRSASPGISRASVEALGELVEWAYGSEIGGDRLSLVQNAAARALLRSEGSQGNYDLLLLRAPLILADVKTQWKLFLEGKVEEFLGQVQALEAEVSATVQAFSERISAMIKSLSDTVLAAVAVLIGSFVASLVKGDTGLLVLQIGVGAYLAYLFVFPLGYNMTHQWLTYRTLKEQFELSQERFEERLFRAKVEKIVGDRVRRARRLFKVWFALTLLAYLVVAGVIVAIVHWVGPQLGRAPAGLA